MAQITSWRGRKKGRDLHDDMTIVVIDFTSDVGLDIFKGRVSN
jgi:hypothetical protein